MFPKTFSTKPKEAVSEVTNVERSFKPITVVVVLTVEFLTGFILGQGLSLEWRTWNICDIPLGVCLIIGGCLADKFGRVTVMQLFFVPFAAGFAPVYLHNFGYQKIGLLIRDLAIGFGLSAPIYLAEISPAKQRNFLLALGPVTLHFGLIYGSQLRDWTIFTYTVIFLGSFIGFYLTFYLHDAPEWLTAKNKPEAAANSRKWLQEPETENAVSSLENQQGLETSGQKEDKDMQLRKTALLSFLTVMGLVFFQAVIITFASSCGWKSFSRILIDFDDKTQGSIGDSFYTCLPVFLGLYFAFQANFSRKSIALISGVSSLIASAGFILREYIADTTKENYVMLVLIQVTIWYAVSFLMGFYTLPWTMVFEIFPIRKRGLQCAVSLILVMIGLTNNSLISRRFDYPNFCCGDFTDLYYILACFVGYVVFVRFILIETHKKRFDEIEKNLLESLPAWMDE